MKSALDTLIEKETNPARRQQAQQELATFRRTAALLRAILREDALGHGIAEDGRTLMEHADEVLEDLRVVGE